jgi:protein-tyrosine-phosphatase
MRSCAPPTWSSRWAAATPARSTPGKRYEDWELDDPAEATSIEQVRVIRDEIDQRVQRLINELV